MPDLLGSAALALKSDGSVQAAQLYAPYGSSRYSVGTMPTAYNFTGQRLDSQTGLLYYNARYYDPISGRFVSADSVQNNTAGMDPYAYVGGNPETFSDPSGHCGFGGLGDVLDCATQAEQAVEQFVDTEPLPVVVVAAVTAPITLPLLAGELVVACLIGCSLGALAGVAYTLLAPQNLASGTIPPLGFNPPSQNNGGTSSSSGSNPPGQNNGGSSPPQTQAGGGGDQLPPKGPPPAAAPPNPEGGQDPRIAKSGTLRDLANKGYKMNSHFVDEFLKEKGLSVGDVENILKNGDYYHRYIDAFDRITGKTLGRNPRIFTIVYNQFADQLHTIFEGGIPSNPSSFESLPNPFDP